jgi:hypothetical protein
MKYKVQLEVPAENPDAKVVDALNAIASALGRKENVTTSVILSNTPDSYSVTVHTFPEPAEKE